MIIEKEKLDSKPTWKESEYNRWTDYLELLCLKDEIVTPNDLIDIWCDADINNDYSRGENSHQENSDNLEKQIEDYFTLLHTRSKNLTCYYPFELQEKHCLRLSKNLSDMQKQYIFLLLCSSICFMDKKNLQKYTSAFEKLCNLIMPMVVPPNAKVELFGTARTDSLFCGTLKKRIETLAKCLGSNTTKSFDNNPKYDKITGGDDGLDLVAYLPIDEAQAIPFAFAQCTCSFDKWSDKQDSVSRDRWGTKIEMLVPYPIFMFVPFSCHNNSGKFYDATNIRSFLIDRIRIIKLIATNKDQAFQSSISKFCNTFSLSEVFD